MIDLVEWDTNGRKTAGPRREQTSTPGSFNARHTLRDLDPTNRDFNDRDDLTDISRACMQADSPR